MPIDVDLFLRSRRGGHAVPSITVELFKGRTIEQKRQFVAAVTEASVQIFGVKREVVRIRFDEMERDQLARGGALYVDMETPAKP
jgi:4-oxalocrotonate tautomerase